MSRLPYEHVRIIEQSATLTGRLVGLLFADQGADVFIEREGGSTSGEHDGYLDRGKIAVPAGGLADSSSADVIIVDGAVPVSRAASQILLRVTAAIPGDEAYGHLAADCSEDLLNALVGIFTDMAGFGRVLGRPVIYTPLPICSVYAGVLGAIAVGAAIVDRERRRGPRDHRVAHGGRTVGDRRVDDDVERHSAAPGADQDRAFRETREGRVGDRVLCALVVRVRRRARCASGSAAAHRLRCASNPRRVGVHRRGCRSPDRQRRRRPHRMVSARAQSVIK